MKAYDLIVIGAGSVGVPVAYEAAKAGLSTLVLDHRPSPGQGEAKTAIGGVRATHSDPAKIRICLRSIDIFRKWPEVEGDDLGWQTGGYLFPAFRDTEETILKGLLDVQKTHGLNIDWIGADEVKELVPGIREKGLRGGTYSPEDGNVSPLRSSSAFYFAAKRAGAEFRFNERVTAVKTDGGRVTAVITETAEYPCANFLNAAGAEAAAIGKMTGLELPVYPDSHEAGITEPVAPLFKPLIVDIRPTPGGKNCYFYQNSENRIEFCLTPDPIFPGMNRESTADFLPLVTRKIVDLLPRMANIRVRRVWRGLYPQTPDGSPVVGKAENLEGSYYAVGMCGQGFMLGPGLAQDIVSLVKDGKTVTEPGIFSLFSLDRDFSAAAEALK